MTTELKKFVKKEIKRNTKAENKRWKKILLFAVKEINKQLNEKLH